MRSSFIDKITRKTQFDLQHSNSNYKQRKPTYSQLMQSTITEQNAAAVGLSVYAICFVQAAAGNDCNVAFYYARLWPTALTVLRARGANCQVYFYSASA